MKLLQCRPISRHPREISSGLLWLLHPTMMIKLSLCEATFDSKMLLWDFSQSRYHHYQKHSFLHHFLQMQSDRILDSFKSRERQTLSLPLAGPWDRKYQVEAGVQLPPFSLFLWSTLPFYNYIAMAQEKSTSLGKRARADSVLGNRMDEYMNFKRLKSTSEKLAKVQRLIEKPDVQLFLFEVPKGVSMNWL